MFPQDSERGHGETVSVEDPHRVQHPETLMLNYGYDPQLSEGAAGFPDIDFRLQEH
jgi:hypothetical protein